MRKKVMAGGHSTCFTCRKMYKARTSVCPQCRGEMTDMGVNFKPPKSEDVAEWRKIDRLAMSGIRFNKACDCATCSPRMELSPGRIGNVEDFLEKARKLHEQRQQQQRITLRAKALALKRKRAAAARKDRSRSRQATSLKELSSG